MHAVEVRAFVIRYQPSTERNASLFAHHIPSLYRILRQLVLSSPSTYFSKVCIVEGQALNLVSRFSDSAIKLLFAFLVSFPTLHKSARGPLSLNYPNNYVKVKTVHWQVMSLVIICPSLVHTAVSVLLSRQFMFFGET